MLIMKLCDTTDRSHWYFKYHDRALHRPHRPRMSARQNLPPKAEPDWQGQYSYFLQGNRPSLAAYDALYSSSRLSDSTRGNTLDSFSLPIITESSSIYYRPQGKQTSGMESSLPGGDDREQTFSQFVEFDEAENNADNGERDLQSNPQTAAKQLAARRKLKRFRSVCKRV